MNKIFSIIIDWVFQAKIAEFYFPMQLCSEGQQSHCCIFQNIKCQRGKKKEQADRAGQITSKLFTEKKYVFSNFYSDFLFILSTHICFHLFNSMDAFSN